MPEISIIIVSHNKPVLVKEAVHSVLEQSHGDWQAILVDSGVLYGQGFFDFIADNRFEVRPSGEAAGAGQTRNMASWCFNEVLNSGDVKGDLVMYLCDDDLLYKDAFATFCRFYRKHGREPQAMYASQDIGLLKPDGTTQIVGQRRARRLAGRFCKGAKLDCRVDYLQFCHTTKILQRFRETYGTDRYHSESKADAAHADGIFMEQVGALTTVYNIDQVLSLNRRTPDSANLAYSTTRVGRFFDLVCANYKGLVRRFGSRNGAGGGR